MLPSGRVITSRPPRQMPDTRLNSAVSRPTPTPASVARVRSSAAACSAASFVAARSADPSGSVHHFVPGATGPAGATTAGATTGTGTGATAAGGRLRLPRSTYTAVL